MGLWYSREKAKIIDDTLAKMQNDKTYALSLSISI
jgi:hypothetical protein